MGPALNRVRRELQRRRNRTDRAENLDKRDVEITKPGLRFLLAVIVLLRLAREIVLQVPDLVRERAVLRHEQQRHQNNLQQTALDDRFRHTRLVRDKIEQHRLPHNACGMQSERTA